MIINCWVIASTNIESGKEFVYSISNSLMKRESIMCHVGSAGFPWKEARRREGRCVRTWLQVDGMAG